MSFDYDFRNTDIQYGPLSRDCSRLPIIPVSAIRPTQRPDARFTSENLIEKNEALRGAKDEFASLKFLKRERFVYRFAFWVTTCRSPGLCKVPTGGGPRRKCVINQRILLNVRSVTVARARTFYDLTTVAHKERCHFLARRSFTTILGYGYYGFRVQKKKVKIGISKMKENCKNLRWKFRMIDSLRITSWHPGVSLKDYHSPFK